MSEVVYVNEKYFASFQQELTDKSGPAYYAVEKDFVTGWCDMFPLGGKRLSHRGGLGVGLIEHARGMGLGSQLLEKTLAQRNLLRRPNHGQIPVGVGAPLLLSLFWT